MSNGIGRVWAVNAEGGDEGRPNGVGPVYIENIDKIGGGVPDPSSASTGDVLTVDSQGNPAWEPPTGGGGGSYTAGDGIAIENYEISARIGTGLEFAPASYPVNTTTAHAIAYQFSMGSGTVSVMQRLDASLASNIESGGIIYTIQNVIDNDNVSQAWTYYGFDGMKLYPAIARINNSYSYGPEVDRANVLVLSTNGLDVSGASGNLPAGTQLNYNLNDINYSLSTINWDAVAAAPTAYTLCVVWGSSTSHYTYLSASGTFTANAQYDSGTITVMAGAAGDLMVSNPLPASAPSDAGKLLTVNAQGAPAWGMLGSVTSIQQVNALPANPNANTLYLIPEA